MVHSSLLHSPKKTAHGEREIEIENEEYYNKNVGGQCVWKTTG